MRLKVLCLIFYLGLQLQEGWSQGVNRISAKMGVATILAHSADLKPISQTTPIGVQLGWQRMRVEQKSWEVCNCFYYLGIEAFYYSFNNPSVLGNASGISATFEPILWSKEPWTFSLISGIGLSYLNKVYDPIRNPENMFFSQPLSFLLFVAPALEYRISPDWSAQIGLGYNHISNGGQKQPNKGMNFPALSMGVFRYLSSQNLPQYTQSPLTSTWRFTVEAGFTTKREDGGEGRGAVLTLAGEAYRSLTAVNALGGGVELGKDYSGGKEENFGSTVMVAPFVAHHFTLGRIDFSQSMAFYLHKAEPNDHRLFQRYVLRYQLRPSLYAGVGLKAHGHVAENIDLRLGWKF